MVAFLGMVEKGNVTVDDILLLFIYLELGAMTGIYLKTKVYVTNIPRSGYQMLASPSNAGTWCA
ncbi:Phosphate-starvation-inducible E [Pseudomonas syringae pv. pisi]|uniref:Phosphate-starvation-inducible E n=2 Tax=Pseudomonas syringae group TaxID=136849 RepID=A0A3M3UHI1_PSESJ|nr:Phosphate-starvation-inducible E [Pseudomonas syringae pv. pisi]RMU90752.1 Phosphate-starvation-inducible E [Pseudomonas savastanoi pv. phaseolicola]RML64231.1 Phosphate-starvation-inducible E [Pseudomonas syringae pv. pisi]RMM27508.1 Phosphate-starvation-inducible E [Pseudomonas syringae pv. pisi]RMO32664.1 Phosphate-starvation-inducible E [Pseudomonas syringae pv. pisi]